MGGTCQHIINVSTEHHRHHVCPNLSSDNRGTRPLSENVDRSPQLVFESLLRASYAEKQRGQREFVFFKQFQAP